MDRNASICALMIATVMAATAVPAAAASSANGGSALRRQGPGLVQFIESRVMSAVGGARGAIAEAEMREVRAKAIMAARAKAAIALQNSASMAAARGPCSNALGSFGAAPTGDEPPSLVDDTCQ
jgi:hypothetical protein